MATVRKRGNSWIMDYYDANGVRKYKSFGNVSEDIARARLRKHNNAKLFGVEKDIKQSITFRKYSSEYLDWYEEKYPDSIKTKRTNVSKNLDPVFWSKKLEDITNKDISDYKKKRKNEFLNRPKTIKRQLDDLQGLLTRAKIDGYKVPEDLYIENIKDNESKPPKLYSVEEMNDILKHDKLYSHWWLFMANTGIRRAEFYNLKRVDVGVDHVKVLSTSISRTKSGQWRYIPLNSIAKKAYSFFDVDSEYLVKRPYSLDSVNQRYRRVCKRAGMPEDKRGIHCLRHSFCSHLIMSGADPVAVQKIMGHKDMKTTLKYIHLVPNYLQDEIKDFSLGEVQPKLLD
jgi:integrase